MVKAVLRVRATLTVTYASTRARRGPFWPALVQQLGLLSTLDCLQRDLFAAITAAPSLPERLPAFTLERSSLVPEQSFEQSAVW